MTRISVLLGCLALALAPAPTQTPVFRGNTSQVVVDVQVTTRAGDVISDLAAADFSLKVDGKPRAISSVTLQRIDPARAAAVVRPNDNRAGTLSLGEAPRLEAQSFVLIVADPALMRPEPSRSVLDQAAAFVAELPSAHSVGLMVLPSRRPLVPFGAERQAVVAALKRHLGSMGANSKPSKADDMASGGGLFNAMDELEAVDGRRTMILLTDYFNPPDELIERAIDANITVHTITTGVGGTIDMSRRTPGLSKSATVAGAGLSDGTGGLFLERASNGSIVMPRIAALLAEEYLLTFEIEDRDRNGRRHAIDVKVNRSGADVRARKSFVR
jgi:VWFA-related protein